jgi:WD domain, G-beta repeat
LFAAGGGDRVARVWRLRDLKLIARLVGHNNEIYGTAFSPDGKRLATTCISGGVKIWDITGQRALMTFSDNHGMNTICYGSDGRSVMSTGGGAVHFWNLTTGREVCTWQSAWRPRIVLSPDDTKLVVLDKETATILRAPLVEAQQHAETLTPVAGAQSLVDLSNPDVASRIFNQGNILKQRLAQWDPQDTIGSMQLAFALAWTYQTNEYESFCRKVLTHALNATNGEPERAAKAYLIRGSNPELLKQAVALAQRAWEEGKDGEFRPWNQMCLGLARYREKDYTGALEILIQPVTASEPWIQGPSLMIQAMTFQQLRRTDEARKSFSAAELLMKPPPPAGQLTEDVLTQHDTVFFWLLHAEARALIEEKTAGQ